TGTLAPRPASAPPGRWGVRDRCATGRSGRPRRSAASPRTSTGNPVYLHLSAPVSASSDARRRLRAVMAGHGSCVRSSLPETSRARCKVQGAGALEVGGCRPPRAPGSRSDLDQKSSRNRAHASLASSRWRWFTAWGDQVGASIEFVQAYLLVAYAASFSPTSE